MVPSSGRFKAMYWTLKLGRQYEDSPAVWRCWAHDDADFVYYSPWGQINKQEAKTFLVLDR